MQPKKPDSEHIQGELFRSHLDQILDHKHPLYQLAKVINWGVFEQEFGPLYTEGQGRPGLPIRLIVGLHYLKHLYNESDESVVEKYLENPYWQYFCGNEYFQHQLPCDPTSLVKWRKRVGRDGIEKLLKETIQAAQREDLLDQKEVSRVNVDTTVQEKAIAFPTDARLYHKARKTLVREARKRGIKLRQSYERLSKHALRKQGSYSHAQQLKRARRETRKLRIYLGRVIRDIQRKCPEPDPKLERLITIAGRIFHQKKEDKHKIYSVHAEEVECISKGKAHKKYEFGCKVSIATTNKNQWIVGVDAVHDNPYDGHTLKASIHQVEQLTGVRPSEVFVDKGYRGKENHPEGVDVYISGRRGLSRVLKKLLRRRSAIEPVISHVKQDNGMGRNHLLGRDGDAMNAILSGCGFNLRKLILAFLFWLFSKWLRKREYPLQNAPLPLFNPV